MSMTAGILLFQPRATCVRRLASLALAVLAVAGSVAFPARASTGEDPSSIVKHAAESILRAIDARRAEFTADPELIREVVRQELLPLIDLEYSARLILGKSGRGVSAEQLQAFADAMSHVLINRYSDGLLEFRSNEQVEILPLKGTNTDKLTRVRTRVKLTNGGFAPVDYTFHKTADGWKAFDVTVEGISYVITYRNQIVPRVESDGIDQVTADILAGNVTLNEQ